MILVKIRFLLWLTLYHSFLPQNIKQGISQNLHLSICVYLTLALVYVCVPLLTGKADECVYVCIIWEHEARMTNDCTVASYPLMVGTTLNAGVPDTQRGTSTL